MKSSTVNIAVITVVIVIAGQWTQGKVLPIKTIVGGTVLILMLSAMNTTSPKLARNFALLILISALFIYAIPVFQGLGLIGGKKAPKDKRGAKK